MPDYQVFGLRLRSPNPLPGLPAAASPGEPDLFVHLGARPPWGIDAVKLRRYQSDAEEGKEPTVVVWTLPSEGAIALQYAEGIRFSVTADGQRVWGEWDPPLTLADAMTFLVGPVLGYALRRRGILALHASAVVVEGRAIGMVGPGGAGKSTLVAALAQRGHAVVTDDILALRETAQGWETTPALDQVRLWEDSERLLFGGRSALAPLSPTWDKRGLSLERAGYLFERSSVPLGGLVLLAPRVADVEAPRFDAVAGAEAILGLVANSYVNYLLDGVERADELRAVGRLVSCVPVIRLTPHEDGAWLAALVARMESWGRAPGGRTAG